VLLVALIGAGGHVFFALKSEETDWMLPWWLLCLTAGINLAMLPLWALIEGCNQLVFLNGYRAVTAVAYSIVLWAALGLGAGLYACALGGLVNICFGAAVLLWKWRGLLGELRSPPEHGVVSWWKEIWPFQWRTGISWASGYFVYNFFTPVTFYFCGPAVAGRMGMTLQLANALHAVAVSWTYYKMPFFGMLVAQRRFAEMDRVFRRATAQAVGVCFLGSVVLMAGVWWLQLYYPAIGSRFLSLDCVALLLLATTTNQFGFALSFYVRAHKVEPFMPLAVINGVATGLGGLLLVQYYGALGVCGAYATMQWLLLPFSTYIWYQCRKAWHS
jgi:hypothetical protein